MKRLKIGATGLAVLLGLSLAGAAWFRDRQKATEIQESSAPLKATWRQYLATTGHDHDSSWWLTTGGIAPLPERIALLRREQRVVRQALEDYQSTSSLTRQIATVFDSFFVSIAKGGYTQTLVYTDPRDPELQELRQANVEICFVPRTEQSLHPSSLYFRSDWNAVVVFGLNWPKKVLPALLYHELGHALAKRQGKPSAMATAGPESDAEEVQMHELEDTVLNAATNGAFHRQLDAMLARTKPKDWRQAVGGLTLGDLQTLDKLLGCDLAGTEVARVIVAQYPLSLGLRFINRSTRAGQAVAEKRALYQYLRSLSDTYR